MYQDWYSNILSNSAPFQWVTFFKYKNRLLPMYGTNDGKILLENKNKKRISRDANWLGHPWKIPSDVTKMPTPLMVSRASTWTGMCYSLFSVIKCLNTFMKEPQQQISIHLTHWRQKIISTADQIPKKRQGHGRGQSRCEWVGRMG